MNETFASLAEFGREPKTKRLREAIEDLLDGVEHGVILSALVQVLVESHIASCVEEGEGICIPCTNASLTELLQTMRMVHDEITEQGKDGGAH